MKLLEITIGTIDDEGNRKFIFLKGLRVNFGNIESGLIIFCDYSDCKSFYKVNGNQFMMFNILERRFNILDFRFGPGYLFIRAIYDCGSGVCYLVYGYFGRIFCGWICPKPYS
jgi:hypothetical protein